MKFYFPNSFDFLVINTSVFSAKYVFGTIPPKLLPSKFLSYCISLKILLIHWQVFNQFWIRKVVELYTIGQMLIFQNLFNGILFIKLNMTMHKRLLLLYVCLCTNCGSQIFLMLQNNRFAKCDICVKLKMEKQEL